MSDRKGREFAESKAEYIVCAAIWYKELNSSKYNAVNIDKGVVVCGHRHGHCISIMATLGKLRTVTFAPDGVGEHIQGFLTSKNRFVDRKEAKKIALEQGQIPKDHIGVLYSEDLY